MVSARKNYNFLNILFFKNNCKWRNEYELKFHTYIKRIGSRLSINADCFLIDFLAVSEKNNELFLLRITAQSPNFFS